MLPLKLEANLSAGGSMSNNAHKCSIKILFLTVASALRQRFRAKQIVLCLQELIKEHSYVELHES